jgi:hypothetical protein
MNRSIYRLSAGLAVIGALALGGCETTKSVLAGGSSLIATIDDPATTTDIYRLKNAYAAADTLVVHYRTYCWARPYTAIIADPVAQPVCQNRRAVVRKAQSAKAVASAAIQKADNFVRDNPKLSAVSLVNAAWSAVSGFQSAVPAVPLTQ